MVQVLLLLLVLVVLLGGGGVLEVVVMLMTLMLMMFVLMPLVLIRGLRRRYEWHRASSLNQSPALGVAPPATCRQVRGQPPASATIDV